MSRMLAMQEPGYSHLYRFSTVSEMGWRMRDGWVLDELVGAAWSEADPAQYSVTLLVHVDEDHTGTIEWPPVVMADEVVSEPA